MQILALGMRAHPNAPSFKTLDVPLSEPAARREPQQEPAASHGAESVPGGLRDEQLRATEASCH